jgi:hypothetical protein
MFLYMPKWIYILDRELSIVNWKELFLIIECFNLWHYEHFQRPFLCLVANR